MSSVAGSVMGADARAVGFIAKVAKELGVAVGSVQATARLFAEGATVPFIARYRKEATGGLDEVAITAVRDRMKQLAELEDRRGAILKSLEERNLLTDTLKAKVEGAETLTVLEDIYAPFRPKRRTRATMARERGLEPLSDWLMGNQGSGEEALLSAAKGYLVLEGEKDHLVPTVEEALAGARDILAERFSEDASVRQEVREMFVKQGVIGTKVMVGKENDPEAAKFRDYFEWNEPMEQVASHRLLAMRRGENEGFLLMRIRIDEEEAVHRLKRRFVMNDGFAAKQVALACEESYKRLLSTSMETEARLQAKQKADREAVRVFAQNAQELLMAPPMGQKKVLALDPGFRTGCKWVVLDAQGKLLMDGVVYPHGSDLERRKARDQVIQLVQHFGVESVAIGNGTASRETETFVKECGLPKSVAVVMVNESGASIYSASDVARKEFPDKDVTVRGAVSIGRRLMDPLAELVKIDPKSIGVGQYQHDVDQSLLKQSLDDVVISCVNRVGVEVNTASGELLSYVSGLNTTIAENIVKFRNENGPFESRDQLKKVPRLGAKTFEQAAGFLRIRGGKNPLDASAVHPESYSIVKEMAGSLGCEVPDLMRDAGLRSKIKLETFVKDQVGLPTLKDIVEELSKPGRDPRQKFEVVEFLEGVDKPSDLKVGMKLPGVVTNVTAFGAFVDVGVHQDGLVHISQLSDQFVKDPAEVVKVGQKVQVTVMEVDLDRKRIGLSMKTNPELGEKRGVGGAPRDRGAKPKPGGFSSGGAGFGNSAFSDAFNRLKGSK